MPEKSVDKQSVDKPSVDEKLQKVLARAGLGSRRAMEQQIASGKVLVNGKVAQLGDRVTSSDKILFNGRTVQLRPAKSQRVRVLLYNKPEGEICTRSDPEGRRSVYENLPKLTQGRWIGVGRLDINTSGALLFTNDGDFAHKLMHPSSVLDREYLVRVFGDVNEEMLQRLREGILLEDGVARFSDIVPREDDKKARWFYCTIMEGRNREVRRLWESQEVKVSRLKRVRYGNIFLPSFLRTGQWLELKPHEIMELAQTAGFDLPKQQLQRSQKEMQDIEKQQQKLKKPGSRRAPARTAHQKLKKKGR